MRNEVFAAACVAAVLSLTVFAVDAGAQLAGQPKVQIAPGAQRALMAPNFLDPVAAHCATRVPAGRASATKDANEFTDCDALARLGVADRLRLGALHRRLIENAAKKSFASVSDSWMRDGVRIDASANLSTAELVSATSQTGALEHGRTAQCQGADTYAAGVLQPKPGKGDEGAGWTEPSAAPAGKMWCRPASVSVAWSNLDFGWAFAAGRVCRDEATRAWTIVQR